VIPVLPHSLMQKEISQRLSRVRAEMRKQSYDALIVYGDNKVRGSLRYLTDYFPDRAGWVSLSATETYLFEGAAFVFSHEGEGVLLCDPGLTPSREVFADRVVTGGFAASKEMGLSASFLQGLLKDWKARNVGIETWDRFPAPLYLDLVKSLPRVTFGKSVVVEELRLAKSSLELEIMARGARVGDAAHEAVVSMLRKGGATELELIRLAESIMRNADPVYEDMVSLSPSLICSGFPIAGSLLHHPRGSKRVENGDVVHWDITSQHEGYAIDTSRTKAMGRPTDTQRRAYQAVLAIFAEVLKAARPGVPAVDLVTLAADVAKEGGFELWGPFLGHGAGLDLHERPDLVREATPLQTNMVLAIEPRLALGEMYLLGVEDMVIVTETGGVSLNRFEKEPLEIGAG
jgi:Xaa-Pro aminopeptidase